MASDVRAKIVSAAAECFLSLGYNGCSVQDIVSAAGVPKGSFYNYFKAKELLALEVLDNYVTASGREILSDDALAPAVRIRNHFEHLAAEYARVGYEKGCLIGNLAAEVSEHTPLLAGAIMRSLSSWTVALAGAIREGQQSGGIAAGVNAEQFARFMINAWEGAVVRMKITKERQPLDDFFTVTFPILNPSGGTR